MIEVTHPLGGLAVVIVDTTDAVSAADRDAALEGGIVDLVATVVSRAHGAQERVALDVRTGGAEAVGAQAAIVDAVRGLVQGYTAESGSTTPPVNVVVSHPSQQEDRESTWRFLSDADGALPRGATFDLRTETS